MELTIITLLTLTATLVNILPSLIGRLTTPPNMTFLGTVHHPFDYFYYLSQFAQGGQGSWLRGFDLYTTLYPRPTFVGWINIVLGHAFSLVGISHLGAYQISTVLFTLTFLALTYLFIGEVFPKKHHSPRLRIISFLLFLTNNAIAIPHLAGSRWTFPFIDYWNNYATPFVRLGNVPHHLIAHAAIVGTFLCTLWWVRARRYRVIFLVGSALAGIILASINPIQWVLVGVSLGVAALLVGRVNERFSAKKILVSLLPLVSFALSGLPMAIYLQQLFRLPPYSQLAAWELTQQIRLRWWDILLASGPVFFLGFAGAPLFFKNLSYPKILIGTYVAATYLLFLSPVSHVMGITNARFLSGVTFVGLACAAGNLLIRLGKRRLGTHQTTGMILCLVILFTIPATWAQLQARATFNPNNAYQYIPDAVYNIFISAKRLSAPNDTFLAIWPFNVTFPGISGRRSFHGHPLLTIDAAAKDEQANAFFSGSMSDETMQQFLRDNGIAYVLTYRWSPKLAALPFLTKVIDTDYLVIYRVAD